MEAIWNTLIVAAILGLIPAYIAWRKGYFFFQWWFFGTALWIVALPIAIFMKRDEVELDRRRFESGEKRCHYCRQIIRLEATVCPHCRREVDVGTGAQQQLEKLKTLLDGGAITQEEFDNLKRKLLQQ
jgi:hypothetical protein